MIKIAICDDDKHFTSQIEFYVKKIAKNMHIHIDVDVFFEGEKLIEYIESMKTTYDIIFLDIEMNNLNGLDTARKIRENNEIVLLIYITCHTNYAVEAYEVHPFHFMVKPVSEERFCLYFDKAYEHIMKGNFYFNYQYNREFYKVLVNDILYFESNRRIINIHMTDGTIKKYYGKLREIEEIMSKRKADFWRIHQSTLVNAKNIVKKAYDCVELKNHEVLHISEERRREINSYYIKLMEEEMIE